MPIRSDIRNIPTLAAAVEAFIDNRRAAGRSVKDHISVLQGATGRVVGKRAAGVALARTEFGHLRMDRVDTTDYQTWFHQRHPDHLSAGTRKRGMSSLRGLLTFAISQGWTDERVLHACATIREPPPRRSWLRPDQVIAFTELLDEPIFDDYDRFVWQTLLWTGVRADELVNLRASHLEPREGHVVVYRGKGNKRREIPVAPAYIAMWRDHMARHGLGRNDWMFFSRARRFTEGEQHTHGWIEHRSNHISQKALRTVCKKVLELGDRQLPMELIPPELSPHVLRRTFACLSLVAYAQNGRDGGWELRTLQRAMGHSSLEITARYLADVDNYLGRHHNAFDPLAAAHRAVAREDQQCRVRPRLRR